MKIILCTMLLSLFCFIAPASTHATEDGIAVIVNDGVITYSDIRDRSKLIMQSSGMPNTQEVREKVVPQIINMLVEEQLKLQEAATLGIEVTAQQVQAGLGDIAAQNNIPADHFVKMLEDSNINIGTLRDQIRAEIAWGQIVALKVRPQIDVTETDIDSELAHLEKNIGGAQYLISEIFLNVESPTLEASVKQTADKLYQQLQAHPTSFPALAQQFSQSAGATQGGNMGWVETGQSEQAIDEALAHMTQGSISAPIRTLSGYNIILLRGKRTLTQEKLPNREAILSKIGNQRLARRAKGYLLDLKANAFIENRV